MLNSKHIDQWMSRLGQRQSTRVREDLVAEINSAIVDLELQPFVPWFLKKTIALDIVEDDLIKALPSDFIVERENTRPYFVLEGTVYYMTKRIEGAIHGYTTTATRPRVYAIDGNNFAFRPVADQSYTIHVEYYAKTNGGVIDDGLEASNLWLINAPTWIAMRALKMTARTHLQNQALAADFAGLELEAKRSIYRLHEAREHQNQDYVVGGISDGS